MKWKLVISVLTGLVLLAAAGLFMAQNRDPLHARARKQWKEKAIAEITGRAGDAVWLAAETNSVKAQVARDPSDEGLWFSEHLILMKNGEWLIYASKCSKEDVRIHDIFVGRASDGKWYYSTYHFCIGMVVLRMEEQPANLPQFLTAYFLREFDGHSDECLNLTWPPKRE